MSATPYIFDVTEEEFPRRVLEPSHETPVLVDFWADWCNPCRVLMPLLAGLAEEFEGKFLLAKVDTEAERNLASIHGIRSLPTVKLFKDGQPVDEFLGALPESEIRAFLERHLPRGSDTLLASAEAALERGDGETARQLVEEAQRSDPGNPRGPLVYARVHASLGNFEAAETAFEALSLDQQQDPDVARMRALIGFGRVAAGARSATELESILSQDPQDRSALHELAARKALDGSHEESLELLLTLLRRDRTYGDDVARKGMLALFDILGGNGELVNRYRMQMFNALH